MGTQHSTMESAIANATTRHTATVIFMHGLGDTGHGWVGILAAMGLSHIKFVCPNAPEIPVSLNFQARMPAWFDLKGLDLNVSEDANGIKKSRDSVHQMIEKEKKCGIPYDRIMVGGFSQGGALALFSTLTYKNKLAGSVALSSWLPLRDEFPGCILGNHDTPILQCHGQMDPVVPFKYGELSSQLLQKFGSNLTFKKYRNLQHSWSEEEMNDIKEFVSKYLPPV